MTQTHKDYQKSNDIRSNHRMCPILQNTTEIEHRANAMTVCAIADQSISCRLLLKVIRFDGIHGHYPDIKRNSHKNSSRIADDICNIIGNCLTRLAQRITST